MPSEKTLSPRSSYHVIDQISTSAYGRLRHYKAPLLAERAGYLRHLLRRGNDPVYIRTTAGYLLQIVEILKPQFSDVISLPEIEAAAIVWSESRELNGKQRPTAVKSFIGFARRWLSFLGKLEIAPQEAFEWMIQTFMSALSIRGLKPSSIRRHVTHVRAFLRHLPIHLELRMVTIRDVDAYFCSQIEAGWKPRSIVSACNALRTFFRFAEAQGWCISGVHLGIHNPRIRRRPAELMAPTWNEVLRFLRSFRTDNARERQGKAMAMLCAIYGFRTIEVAGLQLDDINWREETLSVRKAKGYGVQHYPLHYDVGQAILAYLQKDRPKCSLRSVFLTRHAPYKEFPKSSLWRYIGPRLREIGTRKNFVGPHCLRHACATRLLHKGASLKQIADFLGHRSLKSVDVYARCDEKSLRKVAMCSLKNLL